MVKKENEQAFEVVPVPADVLPCPFVNVQRRLLPCPFCGGSAKIIILSRDVPDVGNVYGGVCTACYSVGKPFDSPYDAAEFWNTRSDDFPF